jgi:hypothetical protein
MNIAHAVAEHESGIDACTEHARQELMRTLTICIIPHAHAQHVCQFSHFLNVHFVYPQRVPKGLMHALSMRIRNLCVH